MSLSSLRGSIGLGFQSAKGVPATALQYLPVLSANLTGEQMAQMIPPEVGGTYFSRGSYKAALRGRGDLAFIPRPGSVGLLLRSLFNDEVVVAAGAQFQHTFVVGDNSLNPHKWLTAQRNVSGAYGERVLDARVGSFRLDIAAANLVNASVQLIGGKHDEVAGEDVFVPDEPVFLTCVTDVSSGGAPFIVDRLTVEIGAQLSDNEFRVGSYFLDDITLLQRAVSITADVRIKSRDLFAKVYRNGAAAPASGVAGAWSPTIYRSGLSIQMKTGEAVPQVFSIELPAVDFLTMPVGLQGAELVRAQLTAQVTLGADNYNALGTLQPITIGLLNNKATEYVV